MLCAMEVFRASLSMAQRPAKHEERVCAWRKQHLTPHGLHRAAVNDCFVLTPYVLHYLGGAYYASDQNPRWTQKLSYSSFFADNIFGSDGCSPPQKRDQCVWGPVREMWARGPLH